MQRAGSVLLNNFKSAFGGVQVPRGKWSGAFLWGIAPGQSAFEIALIALRAIFLVVCGS